MNDYLTTGKNSSPSGNWRSLNDRTRSIFTRIVDLYLETGSPVGSKSISDRIGGVLSSASIRSIMAQLESEGLLFQPHASAGRLPTETGLRLFVDGLMEIGGEISPETQAKIDLMCNASGTNFADALDETTRALSGLSRCASLVICPKQDEEIRHVEFVPLGNVPSGGIKALVVIVTASGQVENRIITLPPGITPSNLVEAGNLMSTLLAGTTLMEASHKLAWDIETRRAEISILTSKVVDSGIAVIGGGNGPAPLILHGHANLLEDISVEGDLDKIKTLFSLLETRENTLSVLGAVQDGSGVQIFIGAENALFSHTNCSMIIAPYKDGGDKIIGAVGVIGPTRMNYSSIIPMVNYTSEAITKMLTE
ncbi:MAG TPA: heat-inducible transcriptional repressor HrcA [Alphaproteobacteria bacterium]|nr:heat-inducible transcriptional repressor HrcA [Alphaproteobacteria bacterium]HCV63419.1 heat-inducible transcriptional repressor HrcA [Alphaproteobacteria bacterium]